MMPSQTLDALLNIFNGAGPAVLAVFILICLYRFTRYMAAYLRDPGAPLGEKPKRQEEDASLDAVLGEKPKRSDYTLGDDGEITPCYFSDEKDET